MGAAWAFAILLVYPALQVPMLWAIVRYCGLRNDDGPRDPVGYSFAGDADSGDHGQRDAGCCANCGVRNDPVAGYCRNCLTVL